MFCLEVNMENHAFTEVIFNILNEFFPDNSQSIYKNSELLQYLNIKTRSANKESKSRGSFANLYAIYVLLEDYILKGFAKNGKYSCYEGAIFTNLLKRQRELPFGGKLQNHALNHRLNEEFKKFFPNCDFIPILRDSSTNRYWINENLINVLSNKKYYNIAEVVIKIIDTYIETKQKSFNDFIETCSVICKSKDKNVAEKFIKKLLAPYTDARLFEIVSFSILKYYYKSQFIYFGFSLDNIQKECLHLYKTGRTNANDGGIDFVMKPLGRFFQVTETLDFKKYFLDIDKIERYPITFVIKSQESEDILINKIKTCALSSYSILAIVEKYMSCIEEIFNIPKLLAIFDDIIKQGDLDNVLNEIILQSKVEFNFNEELCEDDFD